MLRSRHSYYQADTLEVIRSHGSGGEPTRMTTRTAGRGERTYKSDGCAVQSVSLTPDLRSLEHPDEEKVFQSIMEEPLIAGAVWRRREEKITHAWETDEECAWSRALHHFLLTLKASGRFWTEPVFLPSLTPDRWKAVREDLLSILDALKHPVVQIRPGAVPVMFTHGSAAVMAHELIGHPSEAQVWAEKISPFSRSLHAQIAVPTLNIVDDPTLDHLPGYMVRDDEGFPGQPLEMIKNGKLVNILGDFLHSHILPCRPGNARVMDTIGFPTARMSNTVVRPGTEEVNPATVLPGRRLEVIRLQEGAFTPDGKITLTVRLGLMWEGRHVNGRVENVVLTGNLVDLLRNIPAIGRNSSPCWSFGWCTRGDQTIPAGGEAPDLLVEGLEML